MTRSSFGESFVHAASGIGQAAKEGRNFKVQLCFAVAAIALGVAFSIEPVEWCAIVICMACVLGGECANTAIEAVVDLASPDYDELAKRAKDCAAGGVLICSLASLVVAAIIFLPRFCRLFF